MAQSTDLTLANQSGLAFRTELNSILAALSSLQSGSSEPSTTNAYQLWVDTSTTPGKLKIRNGANSAWIGVADDITAVNLGLIAASGGTFTGDVTMNAQSDVRFADSDSSNYVALQGAATISSNLTFTLPTSYGSSGQFLETAGDGTVSFSSLPVGSTSQQGILQLTDSTSSTSTTTAATPDSVRSAYSLANSALPKSGGQMTGNITFSGSQTVDGRDLSADGSKLDGIEASADVTDATNVDAAGAVMNSDTSTASMSFVIDEDNMSSNSATKVPTQQSVKAYVDASGGGGASEIDDLSDAVTNSSGQTIGLGTGALANDDAGTNKNTAVGYNALNAVTTGTENVAVGNSALAATTSCCNVAVGHQSLENNTTGGSNIGVGFYALRANTTGADNIAIGSMAGDASTTSSGFIAIGRNALGAQTTGQYNTAIGNNALKSVTTGTNNTAVGYLALEDNTSSDNTAVGYNAGLNVTTGGDNTFVGTSAGRGNTTGAKNVAIGYDSMYSNSTGGNNTYVVYQSGFNSAGTYNVGIGHRALRSGSSSGASYNTAVGVWAGEDITTGTENTFIGFGAGTDTTTGDDNVFSGYYAGKANTTGYRQAALGWSALLANTTGYQNTAVGYEALKAVTTGNSNVGVGRNAGDNLTTGSNNVCIGNSTSASSATVSNEITLGNSSTSSLRCQVQTISSLSDARDKDDVSDLPEGLDFIDSLRPVKFRWNSREGIGKDGTYEAGFIAQDLQSAQSAADADYLGLVMDENPDRLEASYGKLVPMLVKAIQEIKSEVEQLKANA